MATGINLASLHKRDDVLSLGTALLHLGFVLMPVNLGIIWHSGPQYIFLWMWFGLTMNGLLNLMHECAHYLVFKPRWGSDLLGRWVLAPLAFADFDGYRQRHWAHHRHLGLEGDTKDAYLVSIRGRYILWFFLRCLLLVEAIKKFQHQRGAAGDGAGLSLDSRAWMWRVVIVQAVLLGSLFAIAWWINPHDLRYSLFVSALTYFVVYIYGLMTLTVFAATMRAIAEHQVGTDRHAWTGHATLRNFSCNFLSRLLLGAYGFAEHATHHLEPSVPYYHLRRVMDKVAAANPALAPTHGYIETLLMLIRQSPRPSKGGSSHPNLEKISIPASKST